MLRASPPPRLAGNPASPMSPWSHCETTSGILNPVADVAAAVAAQGRRLIVDAMSAFGGIPFDLRRVPCEAVVASAKQMPGGRPRRRLRRHRAGGAGKERRQRPTRDQPRPA
jgi:hypothetical protein